MDERLWLDKAVAQGEAGAMHTLACVLRYKEEDVVKNRAEADRLVWEAALLGHPWAECDVALFVCGEDSLERFVWLRRAVLQGHTRSVLRLGDAVGKHLRL